MMHRKTAQGWSCVAEDPWREVAVPGDVHELQCLCWECCVTRARYLANQRRITVDIRATQQPSGVWIARHVRRGTVAEGPTRELAVSALLRRLWNGDS